ncbi:metallophosphoesterase [Pedobacter arcticus]|uniref:metallophosphoesterase n=1 Tax=Pedobacter arcticus TaxID=752140 RepID=UPI0002F78407|nr:metallophosphoesterase [Pedobacter arcticus]
MRNTYLPILTCLIACLGYTSCTTYKPFYAKSQKDWQKANNPDSLTLDYTVFLIGDVGKPSLDVQEPTLKLMESQMYKIDTIIKNLQDTVINKTSSNKDAVIFMGDNIYEHGMPEADAVDRKEKEQLITEQLKVVKDFKGKRIFIPGNHDWNRSAYGGLEAVKRQEAFVENYLDSTDVFLPSNGCAGPVEVQMNGNLVIIAIDSEWWLTTNARSDRYQQGCTVTTEDQLIVQIKDIILRNKGKNIVFTMHHPLFSNGKHGGYFTLLDYIFPLTLVRPNAYIPLPVIGSIYPLMRQYGLSRQDISNKKYQDLRNKLLALIEDKPNIVMASGHEHALMLTKYKSQNFVTSGAGSKNSALFKGNGALFGHGTKGFARLNYYKNGQCWIEFWEPIDDGSKGKLVYRSPLYALPSTKQKVKIEALTNYSDSTKTMAVGEQYKASKFKQWLFGEHYRSVWATPIEIPYLDLTKFAGGLTPLQLGGGKQTTSLRLEGKDKIQYQFRTIDKNPAELLPEGFRPTFAGDFVQDQISSAHPYGALVVPGLADAIGVFHANPKVVYMPYSNLLGPYIQEVGGRVGIIEVRPDEDLSKFKDFGYTKNAVSTRTMYEKIREDNDNEVDQQGFLKARLFDILIGDWDRHEDQWRWAEFKKKGKGDIYKPIPRDRDQVFTKFDGVLPRIASKAIPDVQSFEMKIEDPAKLSIAARNLDRNLLTKLTYSDWMETATFMKNRLTDAVIEKSVRQMPAPAFALTGEELIAKLKSRRNQLEEVAAKYYKILNEEVTITGSEKYEYVVINREKDSTGVTMYKTKKDGKIDKTIYARVFDNNLTRQINFYLLDEKDSLVVKGKSDRPIKLKVVGGSQNDFLADSAENGRTVFYDTQKNKFVKGNNTRVYKSDGAWVNEFLPDNFSYDKGSFLPNADYKNAKDGIFLGIVYQTKHYGFRKSPYSFEQKISLLHSIQTKALVGKYRSTFYSLFAHKYDLVANANYAGPAYSFNFYGIGNGTVNLDDKSDYYRVRSESYDVQFYLQRRMSEKVKFGVGPGFQFVKINQPSGINFLATQPNAYKNPGRFLTLKSYFDISLVDTKLKPQTGLKWHNAIDYFNEVGGDKDKFVRLSTDLSAFGTPNIGLPLTLALRLGAQTNIGDYKFYQANSIGNNENLRGFRNERFSGKSAYYANSEVRFPVTSFRNYILTGDFGVYGFYDVAKVGNSFADSKKWHQGYGPGVWINLYNKFLVTAGYGFSKESRLISFDVGYRF